jgi:outer membrane protein OmpA-like peptidoglycan-associated protein
MDIGKTLTVGALVLTLAACQPDRELPVASPGEMEACSGLAEVIDDHRPRYYVLVDATADQLPLGLPAPLRNDITEKAVAGYTFSIGVIHGSATADRLWRARHLGIEKLAGRADNRADDGDQVATCVTGLAQQVRATVPGSDVLGPIQAAADDARTSRQPGVAPPVIAIVSNGLANRGPLDLRQEFSGDAAPAEVARALEGRRELPDLRGVEVRFYHLAQTTSKPFQQRRNGLWLVQVWTGICRAARGAACLSVAEAGDPVDRGGPPPADDEFPAPPPPIVRCGPAEASCALPAPLLFDPGSARLRHDADNLLRPIAGRLRAGGEQAIVTGHTASWGSQAYREQLSRRRAAAVVRRLVELGVQATRLMSLGVGSSQRVADDLDAANRLVEPQASRNRRVVVTFGR